VKCEEEPVKVISIVLWSFVCIFVFSSTGMTREVALNEIAWAGDADHPTAEWIELYNTTDHAIDLSGWRIVSSDGTPDTVLSGTIDADGYLVLYRSDKDLNDGFHYSGALNDRGEALRLIDPAGNVQDSANIIGGAWPAGSAGEVPCTMERIDPNGPDAPENWGDARRVSDDGLSIGSPGRRNSVSYIPPQATFSFTPDPAHPYEPVMFEGEASVDPDSVISYWTWDFGDGTVGRGQTFSHTYVQTGSYSVLLSVSDDHGGKAHAVRDVRVILNALHRADFSVRPPSQKRILQALDTILFTDESHDPDGEVVAWKWNFGDGYTSLEQSPSHIYIG